MLYQLLSDILLLSLIPQSSNESPTTLEENNEPKSTIDPEQSQDDQTKAVEMKRLATLRDLLEEMVPDKTCCKGKLSLKLYHALQCVQIQV